VDLKSIDEIQIIDNAKEAFLGSSIDLTDGIKFIWPDRWIHLRKSNTEPIMRIYAEAPTIKDAQILIQRLKS
jgi:Phosphomannomutase